MPIYDIKFDLSTPNKNKSRFHCDELDSFNYGLWSKRYGDFINALLKVKVELPENNNEFKEKVPNGRERVRISNLDKENLGMYIFNENILSTVLAPGVFHYPTKCCPLRYYINEEKGTVTLKFSVPYGTRREEFAVTVKTTDTDYFSEDIGKRLCILKLICRTNRQYHMLIEMGAFRTIETYIKNLDCLIEVITGSSRNMVDDIPFEIQLPKKAKSKKKPSQVKFKLF